jgi:hypothetical protein
VPVLQVTNEYGNSVTYEISDSYHFDNLLSNHGSLSGTASIKPI